VRLASASAFSTEAQIFFVHNIPDQRTVLKNKNHSRACVGATSIRTFVSEFLCHPVRSIKTNPTTSGPNGVVFVADCNLKDAGFDSRVVVNQLRKPFLAF
jgi:hypothetical protein